MKKNDCIELTIDDISSDGNGVGRLNGYAVFVPHSAPGDRARVKIVKVHKTYAFGIIDSLLASSDKRIEPNCDAYPRCGGCALRHLDYAAELEAKRGFVQNALRRLGGLEIEVAPVTNGTSCERYRNKVQFPVFEQDGALTVGFFAPRSHRIVPEPDCRLQHPDMNRAAQMACALLARQGVSAYDERAHIGLVRHILIRRSGLTGKLMLCLVLNAGGLPDEAEFVCELTQRCPAVSAVVLNTNRENTNVILGASSRALFGSGFLEDEIYGVPVRLSAHSFFQVNTPVAEALYGKIAELTTPRNDETLLDLYCGAGTIGLSMCGRFEQVIGAEIVPQAVEDARQNAAAMGAQNTAFLHADAGKAAETLLRRGQRVDVAVTDPPRKGCDEATLRALTALHPRAIAMVSCNPATLARDLRYLSQAGYSAGTAYPYDMFPRTPHVECVVLMTRGGNS